MAAEQLTISVLLIEENSEVSEFYQTLLSQSPYIPNISEVKTITNLEEALNVIDNDHFDLILMNLFLPDSKGLETFLIIRNSVKNTPIIILTKEGEETLAFDAIGLGAEDYLIIEENNLYTFSRILRNSLERHPVKESLKAQSLTDHLTNAFNRRGFVTLIEQQIEIAKREKKGLYLFLIDLDGLKAINDSYGHKMGDTALIGTIEVLKKTFRSSDIIGRIGGDEFAILAIGVEEDEGEKILSHLKRNIASYNKKKEHPFELSFSVGKAFYHPDLQPSIETLFEIADQDLYEKKRVMHSRK